jgi:rSAM/selenodomain-associated transferase 1
MPDTRTSGTGLALVIMAKEPTVGTTKTRLVPPLTLAEAAALYAAMLQDTIALVSQWGSAQLALAVTPPAAVGNLRVICPPDTLLLPVAGRDIGDCLRQVLEQLLAAGFCPVMALNSDGPSLPPAHLDAAIQRMKTTDVVLGPSEDGGYYLIGLKAAHPELFSEIGWSGPQVTAQTLRRAAHLGLSAALLPTWYDVDTGADLERLQAEVTSLPDSVLVHTRHFIQQHSAAHDPYPY